MKKPESNEKVHSILSTIRSTREYLTEMLKETCKTAVVKFALELMAGEVAELCGPKYVRGVERTCRRGGSEAGYMSVMGQKLPIRRLRVNRGGEEVDLMSYRSLQDSEAHGEAFAQRLIRGVATRDYAEVIEHLSGRYGVARSSVSRAFVQASQRDLDDINGRDLSPWEFFAVMIDGIAFGGIMVLVAMGITTEGKKIILGLREGASENAAVCKDLLSSLEERRIRLTPQILAILDGSKALKKAVQATWGDRLSIQRCWIHKERNLLSYLPEACHDELRRRFRKAVHLVKHDDAKNALLSLKDWLGEHSTTAVSSLEEGFDELLTVHRLQVPASLRQSLMSTNIIESLLSVVRSKSVRVKNWNKGKNQPTRWAAVAVKHQEPRMHRIRGHRDIPTFLVMMNARLAVQEKRAA